MEPADGDAETVAKSNRSTLEMVLRITSQTIAIYDTIRAKALLIASLETMAGSAPSKLSFSQLANGRIGGVSEAVQIDVTGAMIIIVINIYYNALALDICQIICDNMWIVQSVLGI